MRFTFNQQTKRLYKLNTHTRAQIKVQFIFQGRYIINPLTTAPKVTPTGLEFLGLLLPLFLCVNFLSRTVKIVISNSVFFI
jgi:hypothetical protein